MTPEKVEIFEERPATVRAFRCEKERYVGNSHGITLARPGDYIVIDAQGNPQQAFTPQEFLSRYKAAETAPWIRLADPVLYDLTVDSEGRIMSIAGKQSIPV